MILLMDGETIYNKKKYDIYKAAGRIDKLEEAHIYFVDKLYNKSGWRTRELKVVEHYYTPAFGPAKKMTAELLAEARKMLIKKIRSCEDNNVKTVIVTTDKTFAEELDSMDMANSQVLLGEWK